MPLLENPSGLILVSRFDEGVEDLLRGSFGSRVQARILSLPDSVGLFLDRLDLEIAHLRAL